MLSTEKKFTKFMQIVFNLHLEISNSKRACSLTFTLQFSYPSQVEDADGCKTHLLLKNDSKHQHQHHHTSLQS